MAKNGVYKGKPCSADSVKKKIDFQGINICIDRPKGFVMRGEDDKGVPWERTYKYDYGFIPKTLGGDDDGLDVFIGPEKDAEHAYWAVQNKPDGSFDEYKVFLGFHNRDAATAAYREHIPKRLLNGLVTLKVDMMRSMLGINPQGQTKPVMKVASFLDELQKISSVLNLEHLKEQTVGDKKLLDKKKLQDATQSIKQYTPKALASQVLEQVRQGVDL